MVNNMKNSALGLIETYGYVGAVEAADAALKAAEVTLVNLVKVKGGIMTLTLEGEVSAVKASVDAGSASAERLGVLLSAHVIPRLDEEVWSIVERREDIEKSSPPPEGQGPSEEKTDLTAVEPKPYEETEPKPEDHPSPEEGEEVNTLYEKEIPKMEGFSMETMEKLKVVELRKIARSIPGVKMPKNDIKFANKAALMKVISEAQRKEE